MSIKFSQGETVGWSVMVPTFNDGDYLKKCLKSVLEAELPPSGLEVVVIDDGSTQGDPRKVATSFAKEKILFLQNEKNLGSTGNFNRCIQESRGKLVHILHADDWVEPSFYTNIERAFDEHPEVGLVCSRVNIVDDDGELLDLSPRLTFLSEPSLVKNQLYHENPIRTPGVVVRKSVYNKVGGFHPSLRHSADWELWIRILKTVPGLFLNHALANYRFFSNNETHRFYRNGENIRDLLRLYCILLDEDPNFPGRVFLENLYQLAKTQIRRYRRLGEVQAAQANISALYDLIPFISPMRKLQALLLTIRGCP